jgi:predicted PurR-regulated permease PerM
VTDPATKTPLGRYLGWRLFAPDNWGGGLVDKHIGERGWRDFLPSGDEPAPIVPRWRDAAQVATVGIFIILFVIALSLARPVALPTAAAFVVTMMLSPLSVRAERYHIPSLVTAIVLWLLVIAIFYAVIALVASPVVEWLHKAPDIGRTIQEKLALLDGPLTALRDIRNAILPGDAGKSVNVDFMALAQQAVSVVTPAVGQLLIFFVALFFMLFGRRRLRNLLVTFFRDRDARLRVLRILSNIEHNLTVYLSVTTLINAGVGIGAGLIAAAVGLPSPVAWGVLGFVLNFIPYIGAASVEFGMFLVGLVTFPTLTYAMVAPLLYMGMGLVEGQFVMPSLIGRRLTLNPLVVFLSLVFWAWLWGPIGAFLAVPLLIIGMVAAVHLFPRHDPELPD